MSIIEQKYSTAPRDFNGDDVVDHDEGVGGMLKLAKMPVVLLLVSGVGGGRGGRRDRR